MNSKQATDLLLAVQTAITLLISLRAFFLYSRSRSDTAFTLGLSMGVIALGGMTGLIGDLLLTSSAFNTFLFRYIGQTVGYLFIFLGTLRGSERYRRLLKRWHLLATTLLLVLLLLTPLLPSTFSLPVSALLSGSRGLVCLVIFFNYVVIFNTKETRFSFLMSLAFLLITVGITVYTLKFVLPGVLLYDYLGDSVRIMGLMTLLTAFSVG
jgi:hypothetical protein